MITKLVPMIQELTNQKRSNFPQIWIASSIRLTGKEVVVVIIVYAGDHIMSNGTIHCS